MKKRTEKFALRVACLALCLACAMIALSSCGALLGTLITVGTVSGTQELTRVPSSDTTAPSGTAEQMTDEITASDITTEQIIENNIPSEYRDHVYLSYMNAGRCEELVGRVVVTVLVTSDTVSTWTPEARAELERSLAEHEAVLEADAGRYGKELDVTYSFIDVTITVEATRTGEDYAWEDEVFKAAGFSGKNKAQAELDSQNGADANPVAIVFNKAGRAYARSSVLNTQTEFCVLYSSDLSSFRHELYHLFGAKDFYYPNEVEVLANTHLAHSIMCRGDEMDALTAFIVGWDEELDPDPLAFLEATKHLTQSYLDEENKKQTYSGYVENFVLSYGVYTGELESGVPHGSGKITYSGTSDTYEGEFFHGTFNGKGKYTWADGSSYTGDWVSGKRHGEGTYVWADGAVYTGAWVENERTGKGRLTWKDGSYYDGDWQSGECNGKGTYVWANGAYYVGDWQSGLRHGSGVYRGKDGYSYSGEWQNGQKTGYAKETYTGGGVYEGMLVNGIRQGRGTYTWPDGKKYIGEWASGNQTGYGKLIDKEGNVRFEGQWKNGVFQG